MSNISHLKERDFLSLTDDEIRQIVTDIFQPQKITCIKRSKRFKEITCKIYTEWCSKDDKGNEEYEVIPDELILRNPFEFDINYAIHVDFPIKYADFVVLKQFCFSKGIYGKELREILIENPYITNS